MLLGYGVICQFDGKTEERSSPEVRRSDGRGMGDRFVLSLHSERLQFDGNEADTDEEVIDPHLEWIPTAEPFINPGLT